MSLPSVMVKQHPSPIQAYQDKEFVIGGGEIGPVTQKLYDTLTGIQWGVLDDPFNWIVPLD